jgi:hypothetical protein
MSPTDREPLRYRGLKQAAVGLEDRFCADGAEPPVNFTERKQRA